MLGDASYLGKVSTRKALYKKYIRVLCRKVNLGHLVLQKEGSFLQVVGTKFNFTAKQTRAE